jgi:hypothetical protein
MSPEEAVRKFFDCYTNGRPEEFDTVVAPDYLWTGTLPSGSQYRGLSLYRASGGLLRSTRHAVIGNLPA